MLVEYGFLDVFCEIMEVVRKKMCNLHKKKGGSVEKMCRIQKDKCLKKGLKTMVFDKITGNMRTEFLYKKIMELYNYGTNGVVLCTHGTIVVLCRPTGRKRSSK